MLPKSRRIPRKRFKPLLGSKKYFHTKHFLLRVAPAEETHLAVSVSKKISKKALIRNKVKRRVYSTMRNFMPTLKPCLYLIIAKPNAEKVKGEELENELRLLVVNWRL